MPNPQRIVDLASAFYDSATLFGALDAGLFAKLAEIRQADAKTLAASLGQDPRGMRLLCNACVALGLLEKNGEEYRNGEEAALFLVPGSPADLTGAIRYNRDVYGAWGKARDFVRTGRPVENPAIHLGEEPERTRTFVLAMHGRALGIGRAVLPHLNYTGCRRLLDVGGGPGTYAVLIAQAYPQIRCTVLDLPPVAKIAEELIAAQGIAERVQTLPGSYHETSFPSDLDAVNFFGMLHQESPPAIVKLLEKAYAALAPGGTVYVMDVMTDATHAAPKFSALFALNMALTTENGWVFSEAELRDWLAAAGFTDCELTPLPPPMPHWLMRARKPVA